MSGTAVDRVLTPLRDRLIETLAGRSDEVPAWILRLEDGDDAGFFGPGSAAWTVHGGMPTLVAGVRALLLQALHPGALAGVRDFSRFREDPLGRLAGTIQWIHTVTFGSRGQAVAGSEMVRSLHRRVAGTFVDGHGVERPYSANDPELARWVHLAFTDAFLTAQEQWGDPIPGGADGYVAEWATAAELMGVEDAPRTAAGLRSEIDAITDAGELRGGPEVEEIVRFIRRAPLRRMLRPSYRILFRAAVSTLEPRHRALLGLRETAAERILPLRGATAAVLSGAGVLLGPQTQAELAARRRLARLGALCPFAAAASMREDGRMDEDVTERSRTVTWQDPAPGVAVMPTMSGLDYLRAMIRGELPQPPIAELMRMRLVSADVGTATFECEPDESHYNPIGTVHGGLMCTVLDSALGCAVQSTLGRGQGYTSIEITVNYLRPVFAHTGLLTCVATVTKPGNRVAFADGVITDAAGKMVATATGSLLVFPIGD